MLDVEAHIIKSGKHTDLAQLRVLSFETRALTPLCTSVNFK
jgi:hypothetical protein